MPPALSSTSRIRCLAGFTALLTTILLGPHACPAATNGATASSTTFSPRDIPSDAPPVISATLGRGDPRYRVESSPRGLRAINPAQGTEAIFKVDGVTLLSRHEQITIRFSGYGREGRLQRAAVVAPVAESNRAEYRRGALTEWYSNGPYGIEQGFSLASRPEARAELPLRIALSVSGMGAAIASDTGAVVFSGRDGNPLFRCAELTARDAAGRLLPARMELDGRRLAFVVNDADARYPIVVDPTYSQSTPVLSAGGPRSLLGISVAIDGQNRTIVATAQGDLNSIRGFAYVFVKQAAGQWVLATQLRNTDNEVAGVAISGDGTTIVVGSCSLAPCIGHAFVYAIPGALAGWADTSPTDPTATLSAPNGQVGDRIGQSVATDLFGDTVAFGAPCDTTTGTVLCGTVYVFVRPASGTWATSSQPTAQLTFNLPTGSAIDSLGYSVAMDVDGTTIVAGAPGVPGPNQGSGAAYVFVRPTSAIDSWVDTSTAAAELREFGFGANPDRFGSSVAIDSNGDSVAVGAPSLPANCSPQPCGGAYVFLRPGTPGGWKDAPNPKNQDATLTAANGPSGNALGRSVSISSNGSTVVAAANDGAYVFDMPPAGWANTAPHEDQILMPAAGLDGSGALVAPAGGFASVFVSPDASVVGGGNPSATDGGNASQGAVLLFSTSVCAVLTPTSYTFPTVPQYKPATFTFTLANVCNSPLNNISPSIVGPQHGDFGVGSGNGIPCGNTLAANSSCNLTVTIVPTYVTSAENATLTVSDADAHSPQQASISGIGSPSNADFALAPTAAYPASSGSNCTPPSDTSGSCSATVTAGSSASFTFRFAALNGFSSGVIFNMQSDLPAGATPLMVSVNQIGGGITSYAISPSGTGTDVTLTVPTTMAATAVVSSAEHDLTVPQVAAFALIPGTLSLVAIGWRSRCRKGRRYWLGIPGVLAVLMGATGAGLDSCSSGSSTSTPPPPTPLAQGTYHIQVLASPRGESPANSLHSATVTLVVQ
jgi:hypothetical protein